MKTVFALISSLGLIGATLHATPYVVADAQIETFPVTWKNKFAQKILLQMSLNILFLKIPPTFIV